MKIKTILVILLAGTLLASCHGDLNIIQKSEVSANSMWQDEGDATSAMYGMFNKFRATFSTGYIYWGEYRTGLWADGLAGQTARDQVYQNQIPTNHGYANWADLYTTINNANLILKYTPAPWRTARLQGGFCRKAKGIYSKICGTDFSRYQKGI